MRLIDDLLDVTRITQGKLMLQIAGADLHSLVKSTLMIVQVCLSALRSIIYSLLFVLRQANAICSSLILINK